MHESLQSAIFSDKQDQWVLLAQNQTALHQLSMSSNDVNSGTASSPSKSVPEIVQKLQEIPAEFNSNPRCFALSWQTYYDATFNELQFRVFMNKDFVQHMEREKCVLFPWNFIYSQLTTLMASNSSATSMNRNYIEIRFSPNKPQMVDAEVAHELCANASWSLVSLDMDFIYRYTKSKTTYYFVIDITEGVYRWHTWKTHSRLQRFLNDSFLSINNYYDNFSVPDTFAQISSMLLTQRAHSAYSIERLKEELTESDSVPRGPRKNPLARNTEHDYGIEAKFEWMRESNLWNANKIVQQSKTSLVFTVADSDGLHAVAEMDYFEIVDKSLLSPDARPYLSPPELYGSDSMDGQRMAPNLKGSFGGDSIDADHENVARVVLKIRAPKELQEGIVKHERIFNVPRKKRMKQAQSASLSEDSSSCNMMQSIIGAKQSPPPQNSPTSQPQESGMDIPEGANNRITPRPQKLSGVQQPARPSSDGDGETEVQIEYIVLYEGRDYGEEARLIALTTFVLVFILTSFGFFCIIYEQRMSVSQSGLAMNPNLMNNTPRNKLSSSSSSMTSLSTPKRRRLS